MTIARFTPSVLPGNALEQLFVHRHALLDDVLRRVERAATTRERAHCLFVGPRGAGKTHLISLVHHRIQRARADGLRVQVAWLLEDPWDIDSYDDLLAAITVATTDGESNDSSVQALAASGGPIVVLVENLDRILAAIGAGGQRRLRALLENERPLLIVATSTRLDDALLSQAEPFYGFFETTSLQPFTVEQATDMLQQIAAYTDDTRLAADLRSPRAPARLATVAHLAGGQPRVWALLGTGLTSGGIGEMVDALLARFDDLTPYYQEQLARLSPNEAKVVRRLADADRPLTVRDLASRSGIEQRSVAKTVSDLRRRGWIRRHESVLTRAADARLTYYDLAEPLARIAFQVKASRGRPIRLIVEFLATWFDLDELAIAQPAGPAQAYLMAARDLFDRSTLLARNLAGIDDNKLSSNADPGSLDLLVALDDALTAFVADDPLPLLAQPAAVSRLVEHRLETASPTRLRLDIARLAFDLGGGAQWRDRIEHMVVGASGEERLRALCLLVEIASTHADSAAVLDTLMAQMADALPADADRATPAVLTSCARRLLVRNRNEAALRVAKLAVIRGSFGAVGGSILAATALDRLGRGDEAEACVARAIDDLRENEEQAPWTYALVGWWRAERGDDAAAVAAYERAVATADRVHGEQHVWTRELRLDLAAALARSHPVRTRVWPPRRRR